jgi:hypothetical protein
VHPHFTVVIGTKADEVHSHRLELAEIWMTKWDPVVFTQGAVIIAFDQMLTRDLISQMGKTGVAAKQCRGERLRNEISTSPYGGRQCTGRGLLCECGIQS